MQHIAVLLTVHNRKKKTLLCLDALFQCTLPDGYKLNAFLVDDNSTDGTSEAIKEKFPQVNIIQGTGNLFWNRGMYLAWEMASKAYDYDYYLWLNDDTYLYQKAITELIACSESENNQSIICGTTCSGNNKQKITYGGWNVKGMIIPNGEKQICDNFNGNIVLIPQYVYKKNSMNDPVFHHSWGDYDYGRRAGKKGIHSFISPSIIGECNEHEQMSLWRNPKTPMIKRFKLLYSPLGNNPIETFIFIYRHHGLSRACFRFFINHLRAIIPVLWKNRNA
jgi:GT2 family glycosyltransferase